MQKENEQDVAEAIERRSSQADGTREVEDSAVGKNSGRA